VGIGNPQGITDKAWAMGIKPTNTLLHPVKIGGGGIHPAQLEQISLTLAAGLNSTNVL